MKAFCFLSWFISVMVVATFHVPLHAASTVTIDFDIIPDNEYTCPVIHYEDSFTVTSTEPNHCIIGATWASYKNTNGTDHFEWATNYSLLNVAVISEEFGLPFSATSIDLVNSQVGRFEPDMGVVVTGTLIGGGTVTDTFYLVKDNWTTFYFSPDFQNLVSLEFAGINYRGNAPFAMDNVVLTLAAEPTPVADVNRSLIKSLGDINNNGSQDLATLLYDLGSIYQTGSVVVQIKDLDTNTEIQTVNFDGRYKPVVFETIPDLNGNGAPELAILGVNVFNNAHVEIRDSLSGDLLQTFDFDPDFDAKLMTIVDDLNGNGHVEVAILGIGSKNDNRRVTLIDAYTGSHIKHIWFSNAFDPLGLISVNDINQNGYPELAVLGHSPTTRNSRVELRDTGTGAWLRNVPFDQTNYNPVDFVQLPDINQNGVGELVILGQNNITGNIKAEVRDMATGLSVSGVWFGKLFDPQQLVIVPDLNNNGAPELGLLGTNTDLNQVRVELRDSLSADWLGFIWSNPEFEPSDLVVMPDINANDAAELVFFGQRDSDDLIRAIIKDSLTNNWLGQVDFNLPTAITYQIGDTGPAGGIVFYVTDGGLHGLEAAPEDQSTGAPWGCYGTELPGAKGFNIGTGALNTANIVAGCPYSWVAAVIVDSYTLNGYDDWFLPSIHELNELYQQRAVVGGFTNDIYWSSTEDGPHLGPGADLAFIHGWDHPILLGIQVLTYKYGSFGVRAVRAF